MGNSVSTQDREAQLHSQKIDKQIEKDRRKRAKECRVLLLGSAESGKSTFAKQMKILHQDGYAPEERMAYRLTIYKNLLDSAHNIILAMHKLGMDCEHPANRARLKKILDYSVDCAPTFYFAEDVAQAISDLWKDHIIPKVMEHGGEFYLMDNASYFFTEALRIGTPSYVPTDADVLHSQATSIGITETEISLGLLSVRMFDMSPGWQTNFKKWKDYLEDVTSIIFCVALSEYDQIRMAESLTLFESVVNSPWFRRTSIILLLNKVDVFRNKLPKVPLEKYFPEFTGGTDINKASSCILRRFMQVNRAGLDVYCFKFWQAADASNPSNLRLISVVVEESVLGSAIGHSKRLRTRPFALNFCLSVPEEVSLL